ncbi:MAG TPA: GatB/YqeY domain-containing protein [Candidatus Omnitrophota bacterium]|nr:GatB/YqeY domain-containing protein [Candidatus Omnitrophota bacterium]
MTLEEKLLGDFKEALKSRDQLKVSTLSFLRAQVSYAALEKKKNSLDDAECLAVIKKLIKQHQDSIEQFKLGGRVDLVEKETKELDILKQYLPAELPVDAVKKLIDEVIAATGAAGMKDMGKVMKEVAVRAAGQVDSRTVSDLVKERLTRGSW